MSLFLEDSFKGVAYKPHLTYKLPELVPLADPAVFVRNRTLHTDDGPMKAEDRKELPKYKLRWPGQIRQEEMGHLDAVPWKIAAWCNFPRVESTSGKDSSCMSFMTAVRNFLVVAEAAHADGVKTIVPEGIIYHLAVNAPLYQGQFTETEWATAKNWLLTDGWTVEGGASVVRGEFALPVQVFSALQWLRWGAESLANCMMFDPELRPKLIIPLINKYAQVFFDLLADHVYDEGSQWWRRGTPATRIWQQILEGLHRTGRPELQ